MLFAIKYEEVISNNEAEYETLLVGLNLAREAGVDAINVKSDSQLVVEQVTGGFEARTPEMKRLKEEVLRRMGRFVRCRLSQIPRRENSKADELVRMGSHLCDIRTQHVTLLAVRPEGRTRESNIVSSPPSGSWMDNIRGYLETGNLPEDKGEAQRIKKISSRFFLEGGIQKSFSKPILKCLNPEEAWEVMRKIHEGSCGNHTGGRSLATKILRNGYFWPTIQRDSMQIVRKCVNCQIHGNLHHTPTVGIEFTCPTWPFDHWGMDIIGPFPPTSAKRNPKANGQTEVSNRIILQNIKTKLGQQKRGWMEELPGVLWAYRTTARTSSGETPFSLVYGSEALILAEVVEPTVRVVRYKENNNKKERCLDLDLLDEKKFAAQVQMENYKKKMIKRYNSMVKERPLQIGDLVLRKVEVQRSVGKLEPKWEGPYRVRAIQREGTYELETSEGAKMPRTWTIHNLKKFYY
ncbi:UNVERIFIED_CONTAM: hypothetical protein Slati_0938900 [Sesamum latifolium]|uniref:RNase H type-1 domain-containing protein n=1 Tax=Sesamum latifolium TaxID=2727402 RepID=A0AAW2XPC4_9LAMI